MQTNRVSEAADTIPWTRLETLRAEAWALLCARDAIDDCFSAEWVAVHKAATEAFRRANAEMERLAKNPATRYGAWRTPADKELMALGYL